MIQKLLIQKNTNLYITTYGEQKITKKYDNINTRNKNESYSSLYQRNKDKETPGFEHNISNDKDYNHLKNNKSHESRKTKNLLKQKLSINSPENQSMKDSKSYVNKTTKNSYNINNQINNKKYGDYSKYSNNKGNNMNSSLNSNKNTKNEKTSYSNKKEEIYSYKL